MDVILIPGFWLTGASWGPVVAALEAAGHRPRALTLPGKGDAPGDPTAIGLAEHVAAVVAEIDAADGALVLVGHSGGGAIAHAAADARPDRVARVVYVDAVPLADGDVINDELPVVDGVVPLPDWSVFGEEDLTDLDEAARARFRSIAVPEPARVGRDRQVLTDVRRHDVPITVITCEFPSDLIRGLVAQGHPYTAELARATDVTYVDLPTGHWPQLTRPDDLAAAVVAAVASGG